MSDEGKTVTIELSNPITAHEGQVRKVVLREPKYRDIIGHGKPYSVHRGPDGRPIVINDEAALEHYVEACCVYPSSSLALLNMHLHDAMNVREAMLDFFLRPAGAGDGSTTSSGNSASNVESPSGPSGK